MAGDLEGLLGEGRWVRRLAGGLLRDAHAAEDLAQDVLAVALRERPDREGLSGARLRAWLRTVARRLALRSRDRGRARERAERGAARPEAVVDDARERLRLHRRLAAAIDALPEPYRTALVLRYLDDLPPRAIARHLGIGDEAARKRVSRGLALLRERLADESSEAGGWSAWAVALARLAEGPGAPPALPTPSARGGGARAALPAPAAAGASILMTKKLALVAAASLALAAVVTVVAVRGPASPGEAAPARGDAALAVQEPAADAAHADGAEPESDAAATARVALGEPAAAPPARAARLRVVDGDGAPVPGASAAWVDERGGVHALELDASSSAELPPEPWTSLHARAPGFATGAVSDPSRAAATDAPWPAEDVAAPTADVVLTLPRPVELRGRVVEDGGVPRRPLPLVLIPDELGDVELPHWRAETRLRSLGVLEGSRNAWTAADGSFRFEGLAPGWHGTLRLPSTHAVLDGTGDLSARQSVSVADSAGELVVATTRLPMLTGRFLWEDGGPVVGTVGVMLRYPGPNDFMTNARTDAEGRFAIGLPVPVEALARPAEDRADAVEPSSVRFNVASGDRTVVPEEHRVELTGLALPHDLGVLTARSAPERTFRFVDGAGRPVEGAAVVSTVGSARTDAQGAARLAVLADGELEVLAAGFAFARIAVDAEAPAEPIVLLPGATLALTVAAGTPLPATEHPLEMAWTRTPFESAWESELGHHIPYARRALQVFLGNALGNGTWNTTRPEAPGTLRLGVSRNGPVLLPGLRAGAELSVRLVDPLGQTLREEEVSVPAAPGIHPLELFASEAGEDPASATLRLRLVREDGTAAQDASILLARLDGRWRSIFRCRADGTLEVGPLAPGVYTFEARARGCLPRDVEGVPVGPGAPAEPRAIVLAPARHLDVRVVDAAGTTLPASSIELRSATGWTDREPAPDGTAHFFSAPLDTLEARARVGTRTWTATAPPGTTELTIPAPTHVRLEVVAARLPSPRPPHTTLYLRVRETSANPGEATTPAEVRHTLSPKSTDPVELALDLLPGEYDVELSAIDYLEPEERVHPLGSRTVTVGPGPTRVRLD